MVCAGDLDGKWTGLITYFPSKDVIGSPGCLPGKNSLNEHKEIYVLVKTEKNPHDISLENLTANYELNNLPITRICLFQAELASNLPPAPPGGSHLGSQADLPFFPPANPH